MRNWDEEYKAEEYVFGKEPNAFLVDCLPSVRVGKALCLGEGEGRNAVYLARQGFDVTAVDISPNGLKKAQKLARQNGVRLNTVLADVQDYRIEADAWDLIIIFFMHLPAVTRAILHARVVAGLHPGGVYILEGFSQFQIGRDGVGPRDPDLILNLGDLKTELEGLELRVAEYKDRLLDDQKPELGWISVTQVLGVKPLVD